jgi:hypothetical protein
MITEERMREPDMLDHDNEACLLVIKNGNAIDVTIGRAMGFFSFVRDDDTAQESMEWAICNYDNKSGVFSALGDSESIIVDGVGRIGGLLTGSTGKTETSDVTSATPMWWLWPPIKQHFPNAHLLGAATTGATSSTLASHLVRLLLSSRSRFSSERRACLDCDAMGNETVGSRVE